MKIQMVVEYVQTKHRWCGEVMEVTEAEFEEAKDAIKQNIKNLTYVELGDAIIPADFIRNQCVIRFVVLNDERL